MYLGIGGITVVRERRCSGWQLIDATGSFEADRSVRVEEHVVVTGRHCYRVHVRHERRSQDPDGRPRTVGCLDLLNNWLRQIVSHENGHKAVFRDRYVSTSTTTIFRLLLARS